MSYDISFTYTLNIIARVDMVKMDRFFLKHSRYLILTQLLSSRAFVGPYFIMALEEHIKVAPLSFDSIS